MNEQPTPNDAIIARILAKLANPHPCPDCGDLTSASLCAACQEWGYRILQMEPLVIS